MIHSTGRSEQSLRLGARYTVPGNNKYCEQTSLKLWNIDKDITFVFKQWEVNGQWPFDDCVFGSGLYQRKPYENDIQI